MPITEGILPTKKDFHDFGSVPHSIKISVEVHYPAVMIISTTGTFAATNIQSYKDVI
ncbi:MAG: hypothetical protein KME22_26415 [Hassallia sp. WJT32-NPBG1]|nr:hypothetical protein [Hassallia sp. WJT32-NPBG1]